MAERKYITLSELQSHIASALCDALPLPLWVSAEIAEMKVNYSGHCYLELVEKPAGTEADGVAKAQARGVIWRSAYPRIAAYFEQESGRRLAAGMKILAKATVNYHPLYGLSLQITDIDPAYTIGDMERQKQQTIAQLQRDGVWDMNRETPMPEVVQRIAVVSSASAAGYRDFMRETGKSPYRFRIELFEAVMQGTASERSIIDALSAVAAREEEFDAVAIIRGGGATSDLNCYNSYLLASYVAQFPLPVLTGIGHDKDVSVADMVAHTMLKTPTAVAAWLNERAADFDGALEYAAVRLRESCARTTHRHTLRLQSLAGEIRSRARLRFSDAAARTTAAETALRQSATDTLRRETQRIASLAALAEGYAPERIMRLGFAVARAGGQVLRSIETVKTNDKIELEVADGTIIATVIGTTGKEHDRQDG